MGDSSYHLLSCSVGCGIPHIVHALRSRFGIESVEVALSGVKTGMTQAFLYIFLAHAHFPADGRKGVAEFMTSDFILPRDGFHGPADDLGQDVPVQTVPSASGFRDGPEERVGIGAGFRAVSGFEICGLHVS